MSDPGNLGETIEEIADRGGRRLAMILRADLRPAVTDFVTPDEASFQVGFIVYPADGAVQRHTHRPIHRAIVGTSEVLLVREGRCVVELFDDERSLVATRELRTGDVLLLTGGGHGFRMLEDTVLLEVKQGPYTGLDEKERF
jgi:hypothetical protein